MILAGAKEKYLDINATSSVGCTKLISNGMPFTSASRIIQRKQNISATIEFAFVYCEG